MHNLFCNLAWVFVINLTWTFVTIICKKIIFKFFFQFFFLKIEFIPTLLIILQILWKKSFISTKIRVSRNKSCINYRFPHFTHYFTDFIKKNPLFIQKYYFHEANLVSITNFPWFSILPQKFNIVQKRIVMLCKKSKAKYFCMSW